MTAKQAYEKAKENLPAKLERDKKEQEAVIKEIYRIIEMAAENGIMMIITEPIKFKHCKPLADKLIADGFQTEGKVFSQEADTYKMTISWEQENLLK